MTMASNAKADGGKENGFNPDVVETEADLAESLRMPAARDADKVMEILSETESVAIKLQSSWWGNEAFGIWSEWFFVKPDGVSPSGKALFVDAGVTMSDAVGKLRAYESHMSSRGGVTSSGARKEKRKAFNWFDDSKKPGPGMLPTDERDSFKDGSCPLSVIETAVRVPESDDNPLFVNGELTTGPMSAGDVRVTGTKRTKYGNKFVLKGDTYNALSRDGDNVSNACWDDAKASYDGDEWTMDTGGDALRAMAEALNDAGYTFAVDSEFASCLEEKESDGSDLADEFNSGF